MRICETVRIRSGRVGHVLFARSKATRTRRPRFCGSDGCDPAGVPIVPASARSRRKAGLLQGLDASGRACGEALNKKASPQGSRRAIAAPARGHHGVVVRVRAPSHQPGRTDADAFAGLSTTTGWPA